MKRWSALFAAFFLLALTVPARAAEIPLAADSAVLMEKTTGQILYAKDEHQPREPASVTKIMTLLLTMEAIDSGYIAYDDVVTVSGNAASMGGSQVYLAEGEQITVEELLKSVCVASGNDAAVALGEYVAGTQETFVEKMNEKAAALGMEDTHFVNPTGLTAPGHLTSAYDIALMSRELILHHPDIRRFVTIWTDTIRDGSFGLANTNKLVRYYDGCTGLKTGYTASAGYCISATAEKEGMELIAVIMHGKTADGRNNDAKALLNYGFSTYTLQKITPEPPLFPLPVRLGTEETVELMLSGEEDTVFLTKEAAADLQQRAALPDSVAAPVKKGQTVGSLYVTGGDGTVQQIPILAARDVARRTWGQIFGALVRQTVFLA